MTFDHFRNERAETERRRAIHEFLEQYHPALAAGHERTRRLHAEASGNLNKLNELRSTLKHEAAVTEIDVAIKRMKESESELAAALERIDAELEALYAAHQLEQISGEGWTPDAVGRMTQSAKATLYTAQVANQQTQTLNEEMNDK
jgi:hypothetical protein